MYGFPILVGGRGALPSILLFHLCKKILNNELVSDSKIDIIAFSTALPPPYLLSKVDWRHAASKQSNGKH